MKKLLIGLTLISSITAFASDCSNKDVKFLTISKSHISTLDQLKLNLRDRGISTDNLTEKENESNKTITLENPSIKSGVVVSLNIEEDRKRRVHNGGAYEYVTTAIWSSLLPEEPFYRTNIRLRVGLTGMNSFLAGHDVDKVEIEEQINKMFDKIDLRCRD